MQGRGLRAASGLPYAVDMLYFVVSCRYLPYRRSRSTEGLMGFLIFIVRHVLGGWQLHVRLMNGIKMVHASFYYARTELY